MKQATVDYFNSIGMPVFNEYGMSEVTGPYTIQLFSKYALETAGYAMDGCEFKIASPDENGEGEICMRGRNIMMGYLKNEQATRDTIDS